MCFSHENTSALLLLSLFISEVKGQSGSTCSLYLFSRCDKAIQPLPEEGTNVQPPTPPLGPDIADIWPHDQQLCRGDV